MDKCGLFSNLRQKRSRPRSLQQRGTRDRARDVQSLRALLMRFPGIHKSCYPGQCSTSCHQISLEGTVNQKRICSDPPYGHKPLGQYTLICVLDLTMQRSLVGQCSWPFA
ncbi:unnamed protein product [Chrysodeixis includens]|uniref:Uncharacterized protein n=1 Tax=Chrysodeixis includens TaxID=689277 RepID=A0A9N8Q042_CHRIL|nr:unnamed protein product [Chrysodeixis includens]